MTYRDYLASPEWKHRADRARAVSNGCALCMARQRLEVHHRTYQHVGAEGPADLVVLCSSCHRRHHRRPPEDDIAVQMTLPI